MGRIATSVVAAAACLLLAQPAQAHTSDASSRLFPATSEVLLSTPPSFVIPAPDADSPPEVVLRSFLSGDLFPETRPAEMRRGDALWFPPTLPSGTYLLSWEYTANGVLHADQSYFSVSRASHQVTLQRLLPPQTWLVAASFLVLLSGLLRRRPALLMLAASVPLLLPLVSALPASAGLVPRSAALAVALTALLPRSYPFRHFIASVASAMVIFPPDSGAHVVASLLLAVVFAATTSLFLGRSAPGYSAAAGVLMLPAFLFLKFDVTILSDPLALGLMLSAVVLTVLMPLLLRRSKGTPAVGQVFAAALAGLTAAVLLAPAQPSSTEVALVASAPSACLASSDALSIQRCLELAFSEQVFSLGVGPALDGLSSLVRQSPSARFYCHAASHAIGRATFAVEGSVPAAFAAGFDVCDFGFFHGVVEASAAGMSNEEFAGMLGQTCLPLLAESSLLFLQCNHGLGHAAARRANNDMVKGLGFCDVLLTSEMPESFRDAALNGCGTGVTMEWFDSAALLPDPSTSLVPMVASPREVCFEVPERWQPECFEYVGNTVESSRPFDSLLEIAVWCAGTPFPDDCAVGLARAGSGLSVPAPQMLQICDAAVTEVDGCMRSFLVFSATTVQFDSSWVARVCLLLPESFSAGPSSVCVLAEQSAEELLSQSGTRLG